MITPNRHEQRRETALHRRGYTDDEIREAPDRQEGNPLLDSNAARKYVGNISVMTMWRWKEQYNFPDPDILIGRRRFWRRSTLDVWLDKMAEAAS